MKKIFLLATAAMVMAGCAQNDEVALPDSKQEIGFNAYTEIPSRSAIYDAADAAALPTDPMKVTAVYSNDASTYLDYFEDYKFVHNGTNWSGEIPAFYPLSGTMKFAAYCTTGTLGTVAWDVSENTIKSVALPLTLDGNTEVFYSDLEENVDCATKPVVSLNFRHALALMKFTVVGADADAASKITINSITVNDAVLSGTANVTFGTTSSVSWTNQSAGVAEPVVGSAVQALTTEVKDYGTGLLIVPSTPMSFTINYDLVAPNDTTLSGLTYTHNLGNAHEAGKKYVYALTIGLNEIKCDATVTAYGSGTGAGNVTIQ